MFIGWDRGAKHYLYFIGSLLLLLNIIPFLVITGKLTGNYWNKRWSAANRFLSFACFFLSLMYSNITGALIQPPPVGELQQINKNPGNILVRYHSGGSMKLNACILLLPHMVYLEPKHNSFISHIHTIAWYILYVQVDNIKAHGATSWWVPLITPLDNSPW